MPLQSTKIRLEGTESQIREALSRLQHVFVISGVSKLYDSKDPEVKLCYLRCYTYHDSDTLLDQLEAAQRDIAELEEENGELQEQNGELRKEINRLPEELGNLPKPRPFDVVLSPNQNL